MRRGLAASLLAVLASGCVARDPGAKVQTGAPADEAVPAAERPGPNTKEAAPVATDLQAMVRAALADAAGRDSADASPPRLIGAESVTWPDGSLGCPMAGRVYTMALVRGFRIRIQAGARELDYHAGERGRPFLCPPGRATAPVPEPGIS